MLMPYIITDKDLLATRGKKPLLDVGQRVQISARCGDGWGPEALGEVKRVNGTPDAKGRVFVHVLADAFPDQDGKKAPLPYFEAGLVRPVEDDGKGGHVAKDPQFAALAAS